MKALILGASWIKEYESKFGPMHIHKIKYEEKEALYMSKSKDQTYFTPNKEAEFTEETIKGKGDKPDWLKIKPISQNGGKSNYGRAVKKEQSKYSGFAMSYAKDLVIAKEITFEEMYKVAQNMIDWMVAQDKALDS
jgi:hypothetical protein